MHRFCKLVDFLQLVFEAARTGRFRTVDSEFLMPKWTGWTTTVVPITTNYVKNEKPDGCLWVESKKGQKRDVNYWQACDVFPAAEFPGRVG